MKKALIIFTTLLSLAALYQPPMVAAACGTPISPIGCDFGGREELDPDAYVVCVDAEPLVCCDTTAECPAPPTPTAYSATENLTQETLDDLNPLKKFGTNSVVVNKLQTPGGIVSRILTYSFPIAGMILLAMIVWGGFETLAGAASKKSLDAGKQRITAAIVGFLILFCAYWIMQILEQVLGIAVL